MPRYHVAAAAAVAFVTLVRAPARAQPAACACATPPTAPAAETPVRGPAPAPAGTFLVGAGTDLMGVDHVLGQITRGVGVQAGYERRLGPPGSRFAVRVTGDYWRSGTNALTTRPPDANGSLYRRSTQLYGASALGVVQLRSRGAVRPYALAGLGVYQFVGRNAMAPAPGSGLRGVLPIAGDQATALAPTAGLGVAARFGPVTPFAELRTIQLLNARTDNTATGRWPLTLGARVAF